MSQTSNPRSTLIIPILEANVAGYSLGNAQPGDLLYSTDTGRFRRVEGTVGALTLGAPSGGSGGTNPTAGLAQVNSGAATAVVTVAGLTATGQVLATMDTADGANFLKSVVPGAGSFTITLNANAGVNVKVAWRVQALS